MKMVLCVLALFMLSAVVLADPGWGNFGDNSGAFTAKPFYGGFDNVAGGFGVGLFKFPDSIPVVGDHAIALDGFAQTEASAAVGISGSIEKVPNPRDWLGVVLSGPDKWSAYLKVMVIDF